MSRQRTLGPRNEYLLRGGHVLSVDPSIGDLASGDVHIRDGVIVAVASEIAAPNAEVVDARACVVMPGFIDVHWHMWNSIWRGLSHDGPGYFALNRLSGFYTHEDHYSAIRYASLEAINAGITTCHNWANGICDFADAEAEMRALVDSGLRARFGYGDAPFGVEQSIGVAELRRAQTWLEQHGDGRISLGIAIHNAKAMGDEIRAARELGLETIAPHTDISGHLELMGPDVLYTHGAGLPPGEIAFLAAKGLRVGLCPSTDPLIGAGLSPLHELIEGGVPFENIGFSVDGTAQCAADPFASMRLLLHAARIAQTPATSFTDVLKLMLSGAPPTPVMHPRKLIELATWNGARVLGLDALTGSLKPGKRADVILVRTDAVNMMPALGSDPIIQLVQCAQPANVDTVIADGRILKRAGRLLDDVSAIVGDAAKAQAAIRARAGLSASQGRV